jgi:hypothetical protein
MLIKRTGFIITETILIENAQRVPAVMELLHQSFN